MRPAPVEGTGDMREVLSTFFLFCGEAQLFFFFFFNYGIFFL